MKIYICFANSRNFEFHAVGSTYNEAIGALHKGLRKHAEHYDLDPDWYKDPTLIDIYGMAMESGKCYRDKDDINRTNSE